MSAEPQRYRTDLTWDLTFPVRWPDWKSANSRKQGYSNVIRNFLIYPSLLDLSKIYRGLLVLDRWLTFLDHPCWRPLQKDKACFFFIIFSHIRTEYVVPGRSLSVRLYVCLSVVVSNFHNFGPILLKLGPHSLNKNLRWHFSQILKILLWWRHNGFFAVFKCGTLTSLIFV